MKIEYVTVTTLHAWTTYVDFLQLKEQWHRYDVRCDHERLHSFFTVTLQNCALLWEFLAWLRLNEAWSDIHESIIDQAIDKWRVRLNACVDAKEKHFEHMLWRVASQTSTICC